MELLMKKMKTNKVPLSRIEANLKLFSKLFFCNSIYRHLDSGKIYKLTDLVFDVYSHRYCLTYVSYDHGDSEQSTVTTFSRELIDFLNEFEPVNNRN